MLGLGCSVFGTGTLTVVLGLLLGPRLTHMWIWGVGGQDLTFVLQMVSEQSLLCGEPYYLAVGGHCHCGVSKGVRLVVCSNVEVVCSCQRSIHISRPKVLQKSKGFKCDCWFVDQVTCYWFSWVDVVLRYLLRYGVVFVAVAVKLLDCCWFRNFGALRKWQKAFWHFLFKISIF